MRPRPFRVNIIDGADERDSILAIGPSLGLTRHEIARIRHVCRACRMFSAVAVGRHRRAVPDQRQIITAGHILFDPDPASRAQNASFGTRIPSR